MTHSNLSGPTSERPIGLQLGVVIHLAVYVIGASWALGGNAPLPRLLVQLWGSVGAGLTLLALTRRPEVSHRAWKGLIPLLLLNAIVLASLFNPSFRTIAFGEESLLVRTGGHALLPGTARPIDTAGALWLFDGVFLSCFNLALVVHRRRLLRALALAVTANAFLIAIFGSVQQFVGASGPFLGAIETRQSQFFGSFIYHNHWAAFAILATAGGLGLVLRLTRLHRGREFWQSPGFAGLVAVFFLAVSIPLSQSRSGSLLVFALLLTAGIERLISFIRHRRREGRGYLGLTLGVIGATGILVGAVYLIAGPSIRVRWAKTVEQVGDMQAAGGIGDRVTLYRDTWRMARDRPLFGWGMASYPTVFYSYNSQEPGVDRLPKFYWDAHSDWLQSLAELGFVGTGLLVLLAIIPLATLRRRHLQSPFPIFLLVGCGLVLLYAAIEFPFGNPAVVLTWWLLFFAAVRYAQLESPREQAE